MTPEQWHKDKVVAYILVGILAVVAIALYAYMQLMKLSSQETAPSQVQSSSTPTVFSLSSVQSATKAAAVETVTVQTPDVLSKKQAATKAAAIKAFEAENSAK